MVPARLRPSRSDDCDFIFATYKQTLQAHVDWAWGWNEDVQRDGFWTHHPREQFQVIEVDGQLVGGMHVEVQPHAHFVRLIFLLPAFQGLGIGSTLLTQEARRANQANKPLGLNVIQRNPAKALYERLGFEVVSQDEVSFTMRLALD